MKSMFFIIVDSFYYLHKYIHIYALFFNLFFNYSTFFSLVLSLSLSFSLFLLSLSLSLFLFLFLSLLQSEKIAKGSDVVYKILGGPQGDTLIVFCDPVDIDVSSLYIHL